MLASPKAPFWVLCFINFKSIYLKRPGSLKIPKSIFNRITTKVGY